MFCNVAQDVVHAVEWARQEGIALRARSGRHSLDGWSSLDGGLVIDVSRMKSITIDETAGTATVGTGLTQKETVPALGNAALSFRPARREASASAVSFLAAASDCSPAISAWPPTTCWPPRSWCPTAPIGEGCRATEHNNADLLWACRGGGGGNFGIATSYTLKLHELADVEFAIARWTGHGIWASCFARGSATRRSPMSA